MTWWEETGTEYDWGGQPPNIVDGVYVPETPKEREESPPYYGPYNPPTPRAQDREDIPDIPDAPSPPPTKPPEEPPEEPPMSDPDPITEEPPKPEKPDKELDENDNFYNLLRGILTGSPTASKQPIVVTSNPNPPNLWPIGIGLAVGGLTYAVYMYYQIKRGEE